MKRQEHARRAVVHGPARLVARCSFAHHVGGLEQLAPAVVGCLPELDVAPPRAAATRAPWRPGPGSCGAPRRSYAGRGREQKFAVEVRRRAQSRRLTEPLAQGVAPRRANPACAEPRSLGRLVRNLGRGARGCEDRPAGSFSQELSEEYRRKRMETPNDCYGGPERRRHGCSSPGTPSITSRTRSASRSATGDRQWLASHLALKRRLAAACASRATAARSPSRTAPKVGEALFFGLGGRELVTSLLCAIERPERQIVLEYAAPRRTEADARRSPLLNQLLVVQPVADCANARALRGPTRLRSANSLRARLLAGVHKSPKFRPLRARHERHQSWMSCRRFDRVTAVSSERRTRWQYRSNRKRPARSARRAHSRQEHLPRAPGHRLLRARRDGAGGRAPGAGHERRQRARTGSRRALTPRGVADRSGTLAASAGSTSPQTPGERRGRAGRLTALVLARHLEFCRDFAGKTGQGARSTPS